MCDMFAQDAEDLELELEVCNHWEPTENISSFT